MKKWTSYQGMICEVELAEDLRSYHYHGTGACLMPDNPPYDMKDFFDTREQAVEAYLQRWEGMQQVSKIVKEWLEQEAKRMETTISYQDRKIAFLKEHLKDPSAVQEGYPLYWPY